MKTSCTRKESRLLEFVEVDSSHDGGTFAMLVENILAELEIGPKLISITDDNASNNESMATQLYKYSSLSTHLAIGDAVRFKGMDTYDIFVT